jgi:hypothetical protein
MAEPTLTFLYNKSGTDTAYTGSGAADANFGVISTATDTLVFTGGGIDDSVLTSPTCASGTRSATIRPSSSSYVIPYTYIESTIMNRCLLAGYNANRYTMGVYVDGTMSSDLYLEAWDDNSFSTTNLDILQGSANSSNESYINAIRTTSSAPPWAPGWFGSDTGAAYLRGQSDRVALKNASSITDEAVYYNIYVRLETDASTFHDTPVLAFRYTYT